MTFPTRTYAAFLFDMDGTIPNLDRVGRAHLDQMGNRARPRRRDVRADDPRGAIGRDGKAAGLPGVDPVAEAAAITAAEMEDVDDIAPIAGAAAFLASLPPERWTIVTSAPRALAEVRLKAAGLPVPATMIAADDIPNGKPAPDCFLVAAERLGVAAGDCLVFEDAAAGITAGEAAGADVLVITATHSHGVEMAHPTVVDYVRLSVTVREDGLIVTQD
ncbi:HAD-IA family hydrolase [Sphingomonas aurantiaca]|uniref:HAD-IA family hydrolase n=1 Tax=Sphingomonas aurantiaca TaxID=185949 RepID=UPI002FE23B9C